MKLDNLPNLNYNLAAEDESKSIPDPREVILKSLVPVKRSL